MINYENMKGGCKNLKIRIAQIQLTKILFYHNVPLLHCLVLPTRLARAASLLVARYGSIVTFSKLSSQASRHTSLFPLNGRDYSSTWLHSLSAITAARLFLKIDPNLSYSQVNLNNSKNFRRQAAGRELISVHSKFSSDQPLLETYPQLIPFL